MDITSKFSNVQPLGLEALATAGLIKRAFEWQFEQRTPFNVDQQLLPLDRRRITKELNGLGASDLAIAALLDSVPELARRAEVVTSLFDGEYFTAHYQAFRYREGYPPGLHILLAKKGEEVENRSFRITVSSILLSMDGTFTDEMIGSLAAGFTTYDTWLVSHDPAVPQEVLSQHRRLLETGDDHHRRVFSAVAGDPPCPYQTTESFHLLHGCAVQLSVRVFYNPDTVILHGSSTDNVERLP